MKISFFYKLLFIIFLFISTQANIFSQNKQKNNPIIREIDFANGQANWAVVLAGQTICSPVATSYGFVALTDGGILYALSDEGTILWQSSTPGKPEPYLTVLEGDFLLTVSKGNTISLFNQAGILLWSQKVPFAITVAPEIGRDSRIFVRGKTDVACYDIKGLCKWQIKTDVQSDFPMQELTDGSLVIILSKIDNGRSMGYRISPFGEFLEDFFFIGVVSSCTSTPYAGILVTFKDGGAGLCGLDNENRTDTIWSISSSEKIFSGDAKNDMFFMPYSSNRVALVQASGANALVTFFKLENGDVMSEITVENINVHNILYKQRFLRGIVLADCKAASFFTETEGVVWQAILPSENEANSMWTSLLYTNNGYLIMGQKSWTISGYRFVQNVGGAILQNQSRGDYSKFFEQVKPMYEIYEAEGKLSEGLTTSERSIKLQKGMYGKDEKDWSSELINATKNYILAMQNENTGSRIPRALFFNDAEGTDNMIKQLAYYGTSTFPPLIAKLIEIEIDKNGAHLPSLVKIAGEVAYDPDSSMLNALDKLAFSLSPKNIQMIYSLCDSLFEICNFMGRPAFFTHGKDILSKFLHPNYDTKVRTYATKTMQKIAAASKQK